MAVYEIHYLPVEGACLFTILLKPAAEGKFPTVVMRTPYVDAIAEMTDEQAAHAKLEEHTPWLEAGYAVAFQHCRGRGKSDDECIPYIHEREDGLALRAWIRRQSFYNGELFLDGGSYGASVHYTTAPFESDIKGAVLRVQDSDRYNCNYRNGFYKTGLHGGWVVGMYKRKTMPQKPYTKESYLTLPLSDFCKTVFGEQVPALESILMHPRRDDPFWNTRFGGGEARHAERNANIPILFVGGFYDIYTGGMFDMWKGLDDATRKKCAFWVCPYGHSMSAKNQPIEFPNGDISTLQKQYAIRWCNSARGIGQPPLEQGKVTYYSLFENRWRTDDFKQPTKHLTFPLGHGEVTYLYNPYAPAAFPSGLSCNFGGASWQDPPNSRYDIKSFFTPAFDRDTLVRGKMKMTLKVRSDCEDTCFYAVVSLDKPEGAFGLRDDITQISNVTESYVPGETVSLTFCFDEHCFLIKAGERLRIDVSSSAFPNYVRHTNQKGLYATQTTARAAHNTLILDGSELTVPVEAGEYNE